MGVPKKGGPQKGGPKEGDFGGGSGGGRAVPGCGWRCRGAREPARPRLLISITPPLVSITTRVGGAWRSGVPLLNPSVPAR